MQLCSMSEMLQDIQDVSHICFDQNHILYTWGEVGLCVYVVYFLGENLITSQQNSLGHPRRWLM